MIQPNMSDGEQRILEIGGEIRSRAHTHRSRGWEQATEWLMHRLMGNESLRVQTLRFVDVLPTLRNDRQLVQHLHEYFDPKQVDLPIELSAALTCSRGSDKIAASLVRYFSKSLATRFMGGEDADAAFITVDKLRDDSIGFSLDLLGEAVVSEVEADQYQACYLRLINDLSPRVQRWQQNDLLDVCDGIDGPRLYISVKLTSLYSQIDPANFAGSVESIAARLKPILLDARKHNVFVCVDMEQYAFKGIVLDCFKLLLMEPELRDWRFVGLAVQAYLTDAEQDIRDLISWGKNRGCPFTIRLVRGAYWDYETAIASQHAWPIPVWQKKSETDRCYERCMKLIFDNYPVVKIAVATHNVRSLALAISLAEQKQLAADQFEIQMLYGMADRLKRALVEMGFCLRVYVPFGDTIPGMAYLVRRLLENSSNTSLFLQSRGTKLDSTLLTAPNENNEIYSCRSNGENEPISPAGIQKSFNNEPLRRFVDPGERADFALTIDRIHSQLGGEYAPCINGKAVDSGNYIDSLNPARIEQLVGRVAQANVQLAEIAFAGALKALKDWSNASPGFRATILHHAAVALRKRRDEFAAWEIFEAGKTWQEADANVAEAIDFLEYYALNARILAEMDVVHVAGESNRLERNPLGVGLIIPPWNFPLAILTGMTAAAIVMGNTVILKPSSQTPVIAAQFVKLLKDVGLPDGVVQFLPGSGRAVGEYLVKHPGIHFVAFTGSEAVGTRMTQLAAVRAPGQNHIKRVIAEMGGKNAIIVDRDADLDDLVSGVIASAFGYQGQKCSACSRLIVIGDNHAPLLARLKDAASSLQIGRPEDPTVKFGPVIEAAARDRIQRAVSEGMPIANLVYSKDLSGIDDGYFVGPTIFSDVPQNSALAQQEIFGPVLSVFKAKDLCSALSIANDSMFALTGGFYSRSPGNIKRVEREFEVGNLYINRSITGAMVYRQPFGGSKMSGSGNKAGGKGYLTQFTTSRVITENTMRRGYAPQRIG